MFFDPEVQKLWRVGKIVEIIDKADGIAILIFLVASVMSYASMRSLKRIIFNEKIADIVFLAGLFLLSFVALISAFEMTGH